MSDRTKLLNSIRAFKWLVEDKDTNKEAIAEYAEAFNKMLDDLLGNDSFGTEGQFDPRKK
jgi:hypothetical protein